MIIKDINKKIIYIILYITLFSSLLIEIIPSFSILRYIPDFLIIFSIFFSLKKKKKHTKTHLINFFIINYLIIVILSAILNTVKITLFFWALRNSFRFIFFFYLCKENLNIEDIRRIINELYKIHYFNFILVLIQYFIFKYKGDYLGGIFGTSQGCNGFMNIFLIITTSLAISKFLSLKKDSKKNFNTGLNFIFIVITSILISAMSELKVFFLELLLILLVCFCSYKFSIKKLVIIFFIILIGIMGIRITIKLFPNFEKFFSSITEIMKYSNSTGDNNRYIIGRSSFYYQINKNFFNNSNIKQIIGNGFGSAEMSSNFAFLNSDFYNAYSSYEYRNLSSAMIYIETGLTGLISYIFIYISIIFYTILSSRRIKKSDCYILKSIVIISILLIFNIFYNSTSRRDISYLSFLLLSFSPIIISYKEMNELE